MYSQYRGKGYKVSPRVFHSRALSTVAIVLVLNCLFVAMIWMFICILTAANWIQFNATFELFLLWSYIDSKYFFSLSLSHSTLLSLRVPSTIYLTALGYQVLSCLSMLIEIWLLSLSAFFLGLFGYRNFRLFMHFLPGSLRSIYGRSWMFIWAIRVNILVLIQYIYQRFIWLLLPAAAVIAHTPRAPSAIIFSHFSVAFVILAFFSLFSGLVLLQLSPLLGMLVTFRTPQHVLMSNAPNRPRPQLQCAASFSVSSSLFACFAQVVV